MIKLIVGNEGSGKTRRLVEMINNSVKSTAGSIICIEKGMKLTYDIDHAARLIDAAEYDIFDYDAFYGFYAGILASDYDIAEVYVDGILNIGKTVEGLSSLLARLEKLTGDNVKTVLTVCTDEANLPEEVKKYL